MNIANLEMGKLLKTGIIYESKRKQIIELI